MWGPRDQCLIFKGEKLQDGRTLTSYNIVHQSRIQCLFVPKAFDLTYLLHLVPDRAIAVRRRRDSIQTHRFDSIDHVKAKILNKEGIPFVQHSLWRLFLGRTRLDGQRPQELRLIPVLQWMEVELLCSEHEDALDIMFGGQG